jgi:hypothetical protein
MQPAKTRHDIFTISKCAINQSENTQIMAYCCQSYSRISLKNKVSGKFGASQPLSLNEHSDDRTDSNIRN